MKDQFSIDYSLLNDEIFISERRKEVADQILSVIKVHLGAKKLKNLDCLEIGTSSGIMGNIFSDNFRSVVGIDVDKNASTRWKDYKKNNLAFKLMDAQKMRFKDNKFDVIITNQDYEFLEDAQKFVSEIFRVLKPDGICFFGARNRLTLIEGQYRIFLLPLLPEKLALVYLRVIGRTNIFLARYKTYWELRKICRKFVIHDYSIRIIKNPKKFHYYKLLRFYPLINFIPKQFLDLFNFLVPNFIWVLQKPRG